MCFHLVSDSMFLRQIHAWAYSSGHAWPKRRIHRHPSEGHPPPHRPPCRGPVCLPLQQGGADRRTADPALSGKQRPSNFMSCICTVSSMYVSICKKYQYLGFIKQIKSRSFFPAVKVIEPNISNTGETIAIIPIKVSVLSIFSKYSISPSGDINFGPLVYGSRKTRSFSIENKGDFEVRFNISRVCKDIQGPAQRRGWETQSCQLLSVGLG